MTVARWGVMWGLAAAIFAACKAFTWLRHRRIGTPARSLGYLLLWPGLDARAFLEPRNVAPRPPANEWAFATAKLACGAALIWVAAPLLSPPLLKGWAGLVGTIFVLHFGAFHLLSLAWRRGGVRAEPLMRAPVLSRSLGELWGRRWNLGFHDVATELVFAPLAPRVGGAWAAFAVFLASGLVHDLVISVPAGGGYGLPTAYFLAQGIGVLFERRLGLQSRLFAILVAAVPAFWLFHPPFVRNVWLPFMEAIGA